MEALRQKVIDRALQQLTNMGCVMKVVHEGTVLHDTLPVLVVAPMVGKVGKVTKEPKPRRALLPLYYDTLTAMKPGDLEVFCVPDGVAMSSWQGSIGGACCRIFGNGKMITEVSKDHKAVSVLRVE